MTTTSAKPAKGAEPPRLVADDLELLVKIARMVLDYLWTGRRIRRVFFARQGAPRPSRTGRRRARAI